MRRIRIATVFGTRPEFIRLSRLIGQLDKVSDHLLINTGQNYDPSLSEVFFRDLSIREPDLVFASKGTLSNSLASIFIGVEEALKKFKPDGVLILGDTNSSLSAIVAERLGFPVFHMEAGNRSFDPRVPEELNRKLVDHISSFNLPYSDYAKTNLLREGVHPDTICVTGSPIPEIIRGLKDEIASSTVVDRLGLSRGEYYLVSAHRQETVDDGEELALLVQSINGLAKESMKPVLVSVHPRLRSNLDKTGLVLGPNVQTMEPFGIIDYLSLQVNAECVFSDSGSLPEESGYLGFPAVVIRKSFERQESLDGGFIGLAGLDPASWRRSMDLRKSTLTAEVPREYLSENFSSKVLNFVFSKLGSLGVS